MKRNILVSSSGGDIGGNIINILINQDFFECNIFAVDIKEYIYSKSLVNKYYVVPKTSSKNYKNVIENIISVHSIELIIPSSENDIVFFDRNRDYFSFLGVKILINNSKSIDMFLDKYKTYNFLKDMNISTPNTYLYDVYTNYLSVPFIVKGRKSIISKMIKVINDEDELIYLNKNISKYKEFIFQEYIGTINEEYTTTVYRNDSILKVITFKRKLDGDKTGFAEICEERVIKEYAERISNKLLLNGSINIQSRKINDDFYIFEINPRISSTVFIRDFFCFHDLIWWICSILDIDISGYIKEVKKSGIAVIGYTYNFFDI